MSGIEDGYSPSQSSAFEEEVKNDDVVMIDTSLINLTITRAASIT
jgi:hypothetical protein